MDTESLGSTETMPTPASTTEAYMPIEPEVTEIGVVILGLKRFIAEARLAWNTETVDKATITQQVIQSSAENLLGLPELKKESPDPDISYRKTDRHVPVTRKERRAEMRLSRKLDRARRVGLRNFHAQIPLGAESGASNDLEEYINTHKENYGYEPDVNSQKEFIAGRYLSGDSAADFSFKREDKFGRRVSGIFDIPIADRRYKIQDYLREKRMQQIKDTAAGIDRSAWLPWHPGYAESSNIIIEGATRGIIKQSEKLLGTPDNPGLREQHIIAKQKRDAAREARRKRKEKADS